jgi:hypothetical protein
MYKLSKHRQTERLGNTMNEEMGKVLIGYPAAGYIVIAVADYNEFFMTYHKGFMPAHARYKFESLEELLEEMEELAAFSDWKDLVTD